MTINLIFLMIGLIFGSCVGFAISYFSLDNQDKRKPKNKTITELQEDIYYNISDNKVDSPEELILFTELHAAEIYQALQEKLNET